MKFPWVYLLVLAMAGMLGAKHFEETSIGISFDLPDNYEGVIRIEPGPQYAGSISERYWGSGRPVTILFYLAGAELPPPAPNDDTVDWNGLKVRRLIAAGEVYGGVTLFIPLRNRGLAIYIRTSSNRIEEAERISLLLLQSFKGTPSRSPDAVAKAEPALLAPQREQDGSTGLWLTGALGLAIALGILGWIVGRRSRAVVAPQTNRIVAVAPEMAKSERTCRGCGAPVSPDRKRCMNCGRDFE